MAPARGASDSGWVLGKASWMRCPLSWVWGHEEGLGVLDGRKTLCQGADGRYRCGRVRG